jgi:hypothetical protein
MHKLLLPPLAALALGLAVPAQLQTFAMSSERASTMLAAFDTTNFTSPGWATITYGQPVWKADYDAMAEKLKGQAARLGKDNWTTFEASVDVKFGSTKVPAGSYCLAIACSKGGEWSLLFLNTADILKDKMMPHMTTDLIAAGKAKPVVTVPLTEAKAEKSAEKLTIEFASDNKAIGSGSLSITWGMHKVTTPVACEIAADPKKAEAKDAGAGKGDKNEKK